MNKYEKELFKVTPTDAIIYDLIREDVTSSGRQILDFLLEGIMTFGKTVKGLKTRDAYYLVIKDEESELVQIQPNLKIVKKDVTSATRAAANKKSFEFEGKRYKLYRKIR